MRNVSCPLVDINPTLIESTRSYELSNLLTNNFIPLLHNLALSNFG